MSEITKLYENAGIKAKWKDKRVKNTKTYYTEEQAKYLRQTTKNRNIQLLYPPFTAEKQLKLIKWLAKNKSSYGLQYYCSQWANCCEFEWENFEKASEDTDFEQSLAGLLNMLWQSLTEEEKQQVKGILE